MRTRYLLNLLILLLIGVFISNAIFFPRPVFASNITVYPSSGTVGTTVTVKGNGFIGRTATIYFNDRIVAMDVPISPDGSIDFDITIPTAPKGIHTISVVDSSNWEANNASTDFKVIPRIRVFPLTIPNQSSITITGYGFASNEAGITVTWDGETAIPAPIKADRDGLWNASFTINDSTGKHHVSAHGSATETGDIEEVMIIVTPWSTVIPLSGTVGTKFIIEGWGFRSGEDGITVTWDHEIILCNATAESDGRILIDGSKRSDGSLRYELFVPPTTQGTHTIGLYGSSFTPRGILPDYDFNVIPSISIEPDTGNTGTPVNVSGTGFAADETITIIYDDNALTDTYSTDTTGNFTATFNIPRSRGKEHVIVVHGEKGNSGQASFTILNEILDSPQLNAPEKNAKIALYNSIGEVYRGIWKYITSIGKTQNRIYTKTPTILDWSYEDDSDEISYVLQISENDTFTSFMLDENNLESSYYILSEHGMLPKGIYFWRVKAIDLSGNESEWSAISRFEVISMSTLVFVLSIVCLILIVAAIAFGILFVLANRYR